MALNLAPFGRWTLRDKAAQRRLALRWAPSVSGRVSLLPAKTMPQRQAESMRKPALSSLGFSMVTYPIHVKRSGYRGADPKKRQKASEQNRIASELESYINGLLKGQTAPVQVYLYYQIASATGYSIETVRDMCFSIDAGSNGFTAIRQGLSFEQAMELAQRGD